jgi:hypothetical protein
VPITHDYYDEYASLVYRTPQTGCVNFNWLRDVMTQYDEPHHTAFSVTFHNLHYETAIRKTRRADIFVLLLLTFPTQMYMWSHFNPTLVIWVLTIFSHYHVKYTYNVRMCSVCQLYGGFGVVLLNN